MRQAHQHFGKAVALKDGLHLLQVATGANDALPEPLLHTPLGMDVVAELSEKSARGLQACRADHLQDSLLHCIRVFRVGSVGPQAVHGNRQPVHTGAHCPSLATGGGSAAAGALSELDHLVNQPQVVGVVEDDLGGSISGEDVAPEGDPGLKPLRGKLVGDLGE